MRKGRPSKGPDGKGKGNNGAAILTDPCSCNSGNFVGYVCRRCKIPVCETCRSNKHKHHDSGAIHDVASELKNNIRKATEGKSNNTKLDHILSRRQVITALTEQLLTTESRQIDKVDEHINALQEELKVVRTGLVRAIGEAVKRETELLEREGRRLDKTTAFITRMCEDAKDLLAQSDLDIVKVGYTFLDDIEDSTRIESESHVSDYKSAVEFIPGSVSRTQLGKMCGYVFGGESGETRSRSFRAEDQWEYGYGTQKNSQGTEQQQYDYIPHRGLDQGYEIPDAVASPYLLPQKPPPVPLDTANWRLVSRVKVPQFERISDLCAINDACWVCFGRLNEVRLLDGGGTERRIVRVGSKGCRGITYTDSGSTFVTCGDRCIYRISSTYQVSEYRKMSFTPCCLTCDHDTDDLLVCGADGVFSVTNDGIERILSGTDFKCAIDISVNSFGEVCVCDSDNHRVSLFYISNHRQIATYTGTGRGLRNIFDPMSVACDHVGNFIIVDGGNSMLHLINGLGQRLELISLKNDCAQRPLSVSASPSGYIWVGFDGGYVCLYKTDEKLGYMP